MISMTTLTDASAAGHYYSSAMSQDIGLQIKDAGTHEVGVKDKGSVDNYYLDRQAPASWSGKGAELAGVMGKKPTKEELINLLSGKVTHPVTGEIENLADNSKGDKRRIGYDLTFSPPKSVSVMALVGGDQRILKAVSVANNVGMNWIQDHAATIRVKDEQGKNQRIDAGNLIMMQVQHETSRENDPQAHVHNVLFPHVYDAVAGKWRSLSNEDLMSIRHSADRVVMGVLKKELESLGYDTVISKDGASWEIGGVTEEVLREFSGRTTAIDQLIKARGFDPATASWEMRSVATLASRDMKREIPHAQLHAIWKERASALGIDLEALTSKSKIKAASMNTETFELAAKYKAMESLTFAVNSLSEREQAFKVSDLEAEAVKFGKVDIRDVKEAITIQKDKRALVPRVITGSKEYLTTQKAITVEQDILHHITQGIGGGIAVLTEQREFDGYLRAFEAHKGFELTSEQRLAAKNDLMHQDFVQITQGAAGTGKTAAKEFVRFVVERTEGFNIIGVAPTGAAAQQLEKESGIKSMTLAKFLNQPELLRKEVEQSIAVIKESIKQKYAIKDTDIPRVQEKRLEVKSFDLGFGTGDYAFDHSKGEVWRLGTDLKTRLGEQLIAWAGERRGGESNLTGAEPWRLGASLANLKSNLEKRAYEAGLSMLKYRKVESIELVAARANLFSSEDILKAGLNKEITQLKEQQAVLENIEKTGNKEGSRTIVVMDETGMAGSLDAERFLKVVRDAKVARIILQGDNKQHTSPAAGLFFEQASKTGTVVNLITQTMRFEHATPQLKESLKAVKAEDWVKAVQSLDRHTFDEEKMSLAEALATRYVQNMEALRTNGTSESQQSVGVITVSNAQRTLANNAIHTAIQEKGWIEPENEEKLHLNNTAGLSKAQLTQTHFLTSVGIDRLIFNKGYKEIGVKKNDIISVNKFNHETNRIEGVNQYGKKVFINPRAQDLFTAATQEKRSYSVGDLVESRYQLSAKGDASAIDIANGTQGKIVSITKAETRIQWQNTTKSISTLNNLDIQKVDHAYVHTSMKEQGKTNTIEILGFTKSDVHSMSKEMIYVDLTRARINTEIVTNNIEDVGAALIKTTSKTSSTDFGIDVANKYEVSASREKQSFGLDNLLMKMDSFDKKTNIQMSDQASLKNILTLEVIKK